MTLTDLKAEIDKLIQSGIENSDAELIVLREALLDSVQIIGAMLGEGAGK